MEKYIYTTLLNQTISTESIIVTKVQISSNFAPTFITLFESDGATIIAELRVSAGGQNGVGQNFELTTGFLCPRGLICSGGGVMIAYTHGAA